MRSGLGVSPRPDQLEGTRALTGGAPEADGARMALLTTSQAAMILGVTPNAVHGLTSSGRLPCTRTPGGHRRFLEADVQALAEQRAGRIDSSEAARAAGWRRAALAVLRDAQRDLGANSPLGQPFAVAAGALRASNVESERRGRR